MVLREDDVRELMAAGHARIDLEEQEVSFAGRQVPFDIDPEIARRLLEGLDDIGVTLQQQEAIDRYETERERSGPVTRRCDAATGTRATYDRVSTPQVELARPVLERLELRGDETVLDAGCGSGRVTLLLLERLPDGHVIAVDSAPSMVEHAREALGERATVLQAGLTELELDGAVDAVFSNAVFHWIADHERLFARLFAALRPGGRLVAQCGGAGNVERFHRAAEAAAADPPYAEHLDGWQGPWNFAGAEETAERLRGAGFEAVETWLEEAPGAPAGPGALPAHGLPRPPPRAAARGAAARLRRRRSLERSGAGARLRAPEHAARRAS